MKYLQSFKETLSENITYKTYGELPINKYDFLTISVDETCYLLKPYDDLILTRSCCFKIIEPPHEEDLEKIAYSKTESISWSEIYYIGNDFEKAKSIYVQKKNEMKFDL